MKNITAAETPSQVMVKDLLKAVMEPAAEALEVSDVALDPLTLVSLILVLKLSVSIYALLKMLCNKK